MHSTCVVPSMSKMQSSTFVALAEKSAKLTPIPSHVAPSGNGWPSRMRLLTRGPDRIRDGGTDVTWMFMKVPDLEWPTGNAAKPQKLRRRLLLLAGWRTPPHGAHSRRARRRVPLRSDHLARRTQGW